MTLSTASKHGALLVLPLAIVLLAGPGGLLLGAVSWWLGRSVRAVMGALVPAVLAQSSPLLLPMAPSAGLLPITAVALFATALQSLTAPSPSHPNHHGALAGIALGLAVACDVRALVLAVVPLLLLNHRGLGIFVAMGAAMWGLFTLSVGESAATLPPLPSAPWVLGTVMAAALLPMVAYFRMRRRGLSAQDKSSRLLAGILAACLLTVLWPSLSTAAVLMSGPAMAASWSLSRPILPPGIHARLWLGMAVVPLLVQLSLSVAH